jgi:hypothetical protein
MQSAARPGVALRNHILNQFNRALQLLVRQVLDRIAVLDLHLARHQHRADFQIRSRRFPPNPLEHLASVPLPVLSQIEYKALVELNKVDVENAAQTFLREYPGVEAVFTRTQMENGMMPNTKLAKQVILAWHQQISGDIVIMNKPNWYLFAKPSTYASTHGSPWSYDTNVPLAMYGPNWIKPGKYGDSEVVDLARTIAFILNVRPPNGCEGRVLSEALH